jgi:RNA polymerase sigma factor (TIGR02999 family)
VNQVSELLKAADGGDPTAASQLLPLVYSELRRVAARQLWRERSAKSLNPTALVHEAYLRLVDQAEQQHFANRRYFFAAAAEAMRRILIEKVRRRQRHKHGGGRQQIELTEDTLAFHREDSEILAVHEALDEFAARDAEAAELVKLHFFAGFTIEDAAELLGVSPRSAYRNWAYARAWLFGYLSDNANP